MKCQKFISYNVILYANRFTLVETARKVTISRNRRISRNARISINRFISRNGKLTRYKIYDIGTLPNLHL